MQKTARNTISYNPSEGSSDWIRDQTKPGSILNMSGLIEVAVRFLKAWPEDKVAEIIGNATSEEKLRKWVENYVKGLEYLEDEGSK